MKYFARFVREEDGQDLIEYALLATFVALLAAVGANALGTNLNTWYNTVAGKVSSMNTYANTISVPTSGS